MLAISIPDKRITAWMAETGVKETQAWLDTLPMADSAAYARELYQALYTLNRQEIAAQDRFELMELYRGPVGVVTGTLQQYFAKLSVPLNPQRRQLAEFVRTLQMEMANGYKCVLHDIQKAKIQWGKKSMQVATIGHVLHYLGEVLLRSYQVYIPYPVGIWKEIHTLYGYSEVLKVLQQKIFRTSGQSQIEGTISKLYRHILLLGICSPYQLMQNECFQIDQFLESWVDKATLTDNLNVSNTAGQFLVDLSVDAIPTPFPRDVKLGQEKHLRCLNTVELARSVHSFINKLQHGQSAGELGLGIDCLDATCADLLRRMVRFWGLAVRRQYNRTKKRSFASVCCSLNALHFFAGGQRPFEQHKSAFQDPDEIASISESPDIESGSENSETYLDLDQMETGYNPQNKNKPVQKAVQYDEVFRMDRWRIKDESASGLLLVHSGQVATSMRVGDLIGVQSANEAGRWRAGVVRWLKSPKEDQLEMGVEMLSPEFTPVAVKSSSELGMFGQHFYQALLLPAIKALRRPKSLLVPRGMYHPETRIQLNLGEEEGVIQVKPIKLLERSGSFEHILYVALNA